MDCISSNHIASTSGDFAVCGEAAEANQTRRSYNHSPYWDERVSMAHQLADKAEAAYQRGTLFPKRVKLMAAWAAYCASPVAEGANVARILAKG